MLATKNDWWLATCMAARDLMLERFTPERVARRAIELREHSVFRRNLALKLRE